MTATIERSTDSDALANQRWQAIRNNDPAYETNFVFGVKTTGVYCRSTCRGASVLRKNIEFFDQIAEARAAGYRACKRCRPDEGGPHSRAVDTVNSACSFIDAHPDEHLPLAAIARAVGVTDHTLRRSFEMVLGITPRQYAEQRRLERFKDDVRNGHDVTSALYESGFGSPSRLYESSDAHLGMTPGQYRRGGAGAVISYAIVDTPLGHLLVGATHNGVCRISLADDDAALESMLAAEFPKASLNRDDDRLSSWVAVVAGIVCGETPDAGTDLPLDVQGTAFQRRVWEALRRIPRGETRTYSQIAEDIGQPTATRAVANACGKNPTPIVVPCHRVVRSDGTLGGYALGVERKETLLRGEGARS